MARGVLPPVHDEQRSPPEERAPFPTFRTLNAIWHVGDVLGLRPA